MLGFAFEVNSNWGRSRSALSPITHVGANARLRKCVRGNQYQYCVKRAIPARARGQGAPDPVRSRTFTFRPPASRIPAA